MVFGEIFVWIAGRVGNFFCSFVVVVARELAAVSDGSVLEWLISALRLEVLDFSDDALAVDDFSKDNMFLVQMRRENGSDEELGAVCA